MKFVLSLWLRPLSRRPRIRSYFIPSQCQSRGNYKPRKDYQLIQLEQFLARKGIDKKALNWGRENWPTCLASFTRENLLIGQVATPLFNTRSLVSSLICRESLPNRTCNQSSPLERERRLLYFLVLLAFGLSLSWLASLIFLLLLLLLRKELFNSVSHFVPLLALSLWVSPKRRHLPRKLKQASIEQKKAVPRRKFDNLHLILAKWHGHASLSIGKGGIQAKLQKRMSVWLQSKTS